MFTSPLSPQAINFNNFKNIQLDLLFLEKQLDLEFFRIKVENRFDH